MKQVYLVFAALLISTISLAQLELSVSTGYAAGSAEMKLGESINISQTENSYGSYGEGVNVQLRGTYYFNESFGADLSVGYLNGDDQDVSMVSIPGTEIDAVARSRAFGGSLALVYKFTDNLYGRFGALVKIGGKTEAVVYRQQVLSEAEANAFGLPQGSYTETNYKEDFHGHFPLGFVGALGYKFNINNNLNLFVEAEYYGISLKRKDSELSEFNTDLFLPDGTVAQAGLYTIDNLPEGVNKKTTYVDNLPNNNTDSSKQLSQKVPYSSFGVNFGITYRFKGSSKNN
ncbi:outer membrane beta-barrel protein [Olleya sp. YSTF-M6]|uniref:Outer membrane beta-barrel protein n=1 Tax=Olleya sediminilitoris TaxID=2795739 RepID=A0ABS1WIF2_9FLAO|nr:MULTISPECIES: outer membrane beta-barrel protein [Olleya]MBL7558889.1 outer membrane beta-barrel protein [Olleya sediminilitoris]